MKHQNQYHDIECWLAPHVYEQVRDNKLTTLHLSPSEKYIDDFIDALLVEHPVLKINALDNDGRVTSSYIYRTIDYLLYGEESWYVSLIPHKNI